MRCTIRFDAANPDTGDGYCLYCIEELRFQPGELAHMRAAGEASVIIDHEDYKTPYRREHPGDRARWPAGVALLSGGASL